MKNTAIGRGKRIYSVEFMRPFLAGSVFLFHVGQGIDTSLKTQILALCHSNEWRPWFAVECFFIIGGFFLYKAITKSQIVNVGTRIGRLWLRLMPAIIFCYLLLATSGAQNWGQFPFCFFPAEGYGLPGSLVGSADWYVGVYFILSCLFIGLFSVSRKSAWIWVCALMILSWCITSQSGVKPLGGPAQGGAYYGFFGHGTLRGLSCMSLGMVASYLSDQWEDVRKWRILRLAATCFEVFTLLALFNYMYCLPRVKNIAVELMVAASLISAAHGWGYLSAALNRMGWIMYISRYTYSLFIVQGMLVQYVRFNHNFGMNAHICSLLIFTAALPLVLIEYHLVEKWLIPLICRKLSCSETERLKGPANDV